VKRKLLGIILVSFLGLCTSTQATEILSPRNRNISQDLKLTLDINLNFISFSNSNFDIEFITLDQQGESFTYRLVRKYSERILLRFLRSYIRKDYENYFLNSLSPYRAQQDYQNMFPSVASGYRPYTWLNKSILKAGTLELTDTGQVQNNIDLTGLNNYLAFFKFGFLKTRLRFQVKIKSKLIPRSFGIKMAKTFSVLKYLCEVRLGSRYKLKENIWNITFSARTTW